MTRVAGGSGSLRNGRGEKVLADVGEGLVSAGVAREVYGVEFSAGERA